MTDILTDEQLREIEARANAGRVWCVDGWIRANVPGTKEINALIATLRAERELRRKAEQERDQWEQVADVLAECFRPCGCRHPACKACKCDDLVREALAEREKEDVSDE